MGFRRISPNTSAFQSHASASITLAVDYEGRLNTVLNRGGRRPAPEAVERILLDAVRNRLEAAGALKRLGNGEGEREQLSAAAGNLARIADSYEEAGPAHGTSAAKFRDMAADTYMRAGRKDLAKEQYLIAGEDRLDVAGSMKMEKSIRWMLRKRRVLVGAIRDLKKGGVEGEEEARIASFMIVRTTHDVLVPSNGTGVRASH